MKKILWVGDGVTPTGFATVNHNIIKNLPREKYEVHHLAINYYGDPHPYEHLVYPASTPQSLQRGDVYGFTRLEDILDMKPDMVFILNDIWVTAKYLEIIKNKLKDNFPPIVVYYPVDGAGYQREWFKDFDIVTKVVVYTDFGKRVTLSVYPEAEDKIEVLPHGNDTTVFYPLENKKELRKQTFAKIPELWEDDSFIVLNANRNQPRKRLDLSIKAFALFALGKPSNVRYYHHAGLKDAGWDILRLVKQIDRAFLNQGVLKPEDVKLEDRLVVTNMEQMVQKVSLEELNRIYNLADVGINTSLGEGWGLTATENAATRVAQIVPNHTACAELFHDCGLLTNIIQTVNDPQTLVYRSFIDVDNLANQLQYLYENPDVRKDLAEKGFTKFTSDEYKWESIAKRWETLFESVLT